MSRLGVPPYGDGPLGSGLARFFFRFESIFSILLPPSRVRDAPCTWLIVSKVVMHVVGVSFLV